MPRNLKERMKSASRCLNLLSTLKLPYAVFTRYARIFGVSLVSYGWLAKLPTLGETKKLWSTIKRGQRTGLMANAWIRAIIFGGVHHLDCVTATQLLRIVSALFAKGWVNWSSTAGCPVHSLRNWLKNRGWKEKGQQHWAHGCGLLERSVRPCAHLGTDGNYIVLGSISEWKQAQVASAGSNHCL